MILVSFSSAEDVWSNDVNKYNTFSSQGTEKSTVPLFLGHPVYLRMMAGHSINVPIIYI